MSRPISDNNTVNDCTCSEEKKNFSETFSCPQNAANLASNAPFYSYSTFMWRFQDKIRAYRGGLQRVTS